MAALGWLRRGGAEIVAWLLPLLVFVEYVGTTYGNTVAATFALLAVFAGVLFVSPPDAAPRAWPRWLVIAGRAVGPLLIVAGGVGIYAALATILDPLHHRPPPLPTERHREAFLWAPIPWAYLAAVGFRLTDSKSSGRHFERLGLLIALVLLVHMVGKQRVQNLAVLPYWRAGLTSLTVTASVTLLALLFVPKLPAVVRLLALMGAGLGLRWVGLESWQIDPAVRDMLPLVKSAQDSFLSGHDPYTLYQMQRGSVVPLTYLPGMWIAWGLPRLFAADFRTMGVVADAVVVGSLFWAASGVRESLRARAQGIAIGFGAVWLFSPSVAWNGIYAEPHMWWMLLALVIAATLRQRWWLAAAALGFALATRHFAIVVAPFVLLAMWRAVGWRALVPRLAVTGSIAALLLVPFVVADPETFWFGTFRWLVEYGPVHQGWFYTKFGFSGPLYKAHEEVWMHRAQLGLPLVVLVLGLFHRGTRRYIAPAGLAYVLLVMFNGIIWDSFYLGASLFAAFAAAGGYALATEPRVRAPGKLALGAGAVLLAASGVAGGYLLFSLAKTQSRSGHDSLANDLAARLGPGAALVDRTDWNLAFVKGNPLFEGKPVPVPWGREVFDRSLGLTGVFGRPRAFFALREDRDRDLVRELRAAGLIEQDTSFGHYELLSVTGLDIEQRLAALPGKYIPRTCGLGGMQRQMAGPRGGTGKRVKLSFSGVRFGKAFVLLAGNDDRLIVWGREESHLRLTVDGKQAASLRVPNLPGVHFTIVSTERFGEGPHELEVVAGSKRGDPGTICVDGFVLR